MRVIIAVLALFVGIFILTTINSIGELQKLHEERELIEQELTEDDTVKDSVYVDHKKEIEKL